MHVLSIQISLKDKKNKKISFKKKEQFKGQVKKTRPILVLIGTLLRTG